MSGGFFLKYSPLAKMSSFFGRFVGEHESKVKTDTLQRLHTCVNLAELLEAKHQGIDPTLRDDQV